MSCSEESKTLGNFVMKEDEFVAYTGLLAPSPKAYLQLEETKMIRNFADLGEENLSRLPSFIDLSAGLPLPGNQGKQHSCTGWALSFAIRSFQENREMGWGLTEDHLFSPSFVYNQINGGLDEGANLLEAIGFLMKEGTVPLRLMPYRENDYQIKPSEDLLSLAKAFRILGYRRIQEKNINHIRSYLASGEPILFVVKMYSNFLAKGMRQTKGVYSQKEGKFLGLHALVGVGYNDEKKAVKVLNSWGSFWGDRGYAWISYDFLPEVIDQAYLVYDTPTSPQAVARIHEETALPTSLASGQMPQNHSLKKGKVGFASLESELLLVPEEGGIVLDGKWLRLTDPLEKLDSFFQSPPSHVQIMEDVLKNGLVSRMHFYPGKGLPVYTHQGIGFDSTKADVYRIYGKPDFVDAQSKEETYFFKAIAEKWGGLDLVKYASLNFHYDEKEKVNFMSLEHVFKEVKKGEGLQTVHHQNISQDKIRFVFPSQFTDIKQSRWENLGYGYFANNPLDMNESITVKVFDAVGKVDETLIQERIAADLKMLRLNSEGTVHRAPTMQEKETFGGIDWVKVSEDPTHSRYYGGYGKTLYQIQLISHQKINEEKWVGEFLNSVVIRK